MVLKVKAVERWDSFSFKYHTLNMSQTNINPLGLYLFGLGGVYWTKFECISDKIRRILTTNRTRGARSGSKPLRTLRLRGDSRQCASDTLADSRVQKPKKFLAFS